MDTTVIHTVTTLLAVFSLTVVGQDEQPSQQQLLITPEGQNHTKSVDSSVRFTCTLTDLVTSDLTSLSLPPPPIRWRGPEMEYIEATKGRVRVERVDEATLLLYIDQLYRRDAGQYSCESDYDGLLLSQEIQLIVYEEIQFAETPTSVDSKLAESALLECSASGQPKPEVSWRFNNNKITPENVKYELVGASSLRVNDIEMTDSGLYSCRAEVDSLGTLKVRDIQLNVIYAPILTETPQVGVVVKGTQLILRCSAHGNPPVKYQWIKEQDMSDVVKMKIRLAGENSEKLVIESVQSTDEGRYICVVSNSLGTTEAYVDVNMLAYPEVRPLPTEKRAVEGRPVIAVCEASGEPEPTVHWSRTDRTQPFSIGQQPDDKDVTVDGIQRTMARLLIQNVRRAHSANYTCTANNIVGNDTKIMQLIVEYLPSILNDSSQQQQQLGWTGQRRQFSCSATGLPVPTVTWSRAGQFIANSATYRMTASTSDLVTTSLLEVTIGENQPWLYGNYLCTAKNIHGYSSKTFNLKEAGTPRSPQNITVLEETSGSVTFGVSTAHDVDELPVSKWLVVYKLDTSSSSSAAAAAVTPGEEQDKSRILDNVGDRLTVNGLLPSQVYTFYLSAGNEVGFGPSVKFRVETPAAKLEQSDVPRDIPGPVIVDSFPSSKEALEKSSSSSSSAASSGGKYAWIAFGVLAAVAVAALATAGLTIWYRRRRQREDGTSSIEDALKSETTTSKNSPAHQTSPGATNGVAAGHRFVPFWRKQQNSPSVDTESQRSAGYGKLSGGRRVWIRVREIFHRSPSSTNPAADVSVAAEQSCELVSVVDRKETALEDVAASSVGGKAAAVSDEEHRFLPDVSSPFGGTQSPTPSRRAVLHKSTSDPRYSPAPRRAPCTPPPAVHRSNAAGTPTAHQRLAWESLRSPGSVGAEDHCGVDASATGSGGTAVTVTPEVCADLLPETDYLFRRFVGDTLPPPRPRDQLDSTDVDESSIHDILDGYHSEDNIDDDDDDKDDVSDSLSPAKEHQIPR